MYTLLLRRLPVLRLPHLSKPGPSCGFASRGVQKSSDASAKKKNPYPKSARDVYEASEVGDEEDVFYPSEPPLRKGSSRGGQESAPQSKWAETWRKQDLDNNNDKQKLSSSSPFSPSSSKDANFMDRYENEVKKEKRGKRRDNDEAYREERGESDVEERGSGRGRAVIERGGTTGEEKKQEEQERRREGTPRVKDRGWKGGLDRYKDVWRERGREEKKKEQKNQKRENAWRGERSEEAQEYQEIQNIIKEKQQQQQQQQVPRFYDEDEEMLEAVEKKKSVVNEDDLYSPEQRQKRRERESNGNNTAGNASMRKKNEKNPFSSSSSSLPSTKKAGLKVEDYFEEERSASSSSASSFSPSSFSSSSYFRSLDKNNTENSATSSSASFRKNEIGYGDNFSSSASSSPSSLSQRDKQRNNKVRNLVSREDEQDRKEKDGEDVEIGRGSWQGGEGKKYNEETGKTEKVRWGARRPKPEEGKIDEQTEWENKIGRRFGKRMSNRCVLLEDDGRIDNENDEDFFSADEDGNDDIAEEERKTSNSTELRSNSRNNSNRTREGDARETKKETQFSSSFAPRKLKILRDKNSTEESEAEEDEFVPRQRMSSAEATKHRVNP